MSGKSTVYYPTDSLLKNRDRVRSRRVHGTRKPLSYHSDSFSCAAHANPVLLKLDNTATSLSTRFSGVSLQRAHSIHFFTAIDRYNALWSSPERSFRRDCGRFGWYLRSYREQCLSGCYRVWAQATGRSWPILGKVLRDAIMSSLLRESTYLGSCRRTAQCNENYIVHYRKRSRFSNVPEVIIRQLERTWTCSRCSSARARSIIGSKSYTRAISPIIGKHRYILKYLHLFTILVVITNHVAHSKLICVSTRHIRHTEETRY